MMTAIFLGILSLSFFVVIDILYKVLSIIVNKSVYSKEDLPNLGPIATTTFFSSMIGELLTLGDGSLFFTEKMKHFLKAAHKPYLDSAERCKHKPMYADIH